MTDDQRFPAYDPAGFWDGLAVMGREFNQSVPALLKMRYTQFVALQTAAIRAGKRESEARKKKRR